MKDLTPMARRRIRMRWWLCALPLAIVAGLTAAAATTRSSVWIIRHGLATAGRMPSLTLEGADGTLLSGLTLRGLRVPLSGGQLEVERVELPSLAAVWRGDRRVQFTQLRLSGQPYAERVTIEAAQVRVSDHVTANGIRLDGLPWWPAGNALEIQRVEAGWPLRWSTLRVVHNARLLVPHGDPVVVFATQDDERAALHLYAKSLDVGDVLEAIPGWRSARTLDGILTDVDLGLEGPRDALRLTGRLSVDRLVYGTARYERGDVRTALTVLGWPSQVPRLEGDVLIRGGAVTTRRLTAGVRSGRLRFQPETWRPALDLDGVSTVEGLPIHVRVGGVWGRPELTLSSDPPRDQEALLAMWITGKRWRGAEDALAEGRISSELATDTLDYLLFGGRAGQLARRLGINELALTANADTGRVGVQTTIADKVSVGMEVDPDELSNALQAASQPADAASRKPPLPYKLEAEYHVTESTSLQVEGERAPLAPQTSTPPASSSTQTLPQTDDKVLLRLKTRF